MRNLFSWKLRPSEADFKELWEKATFVFDTNYLLDLYRASRTTSQDHLITLERLQDRIWLPYQVADEFLDRREGVINEEAASFQKALSAIKGWKQGEQKFDKLRGSINQLGRIVASEVEHLFKEQDAYLSAVEQVEENFRKKIEEISNAHSPLSSEDDYILEKILLLFDGKVGKPYTVETLENLHKEAEDRYSQKIPPGFMDEEKKDKRKYGDFILWKQIIDFAKAKSCPIILVTREKKEDWWIKETDNRINSPHTKLRYEFQKEVEALFWMYQPQYFLQEAKERLKIDIDQRSIEETDEIVDVEAIEEEDVEVGNQEAEQARFSNRAERSLLNLYFQRDELGRRLLEQLDMENARNSKWAQQLFNQSFQIDGSGRRLLEQLDMENARSSKWAQQLLSQIPQMDMFGRQLLEQSQTITGKQRNLQGISDNPIKPEQLEKTSTSEVLQEQSSQSTGETEKQDQESLSSETSDPQASSEEIKPGRKKRSHSTKRNDSNLKD